MTRWHKLYLGLGLLLTAVGLLLPSSWFTPLPQREVLPTPPISGWWVLQFSFVVQGLTLIGLGFRRWEFKPLDSDNRSSFAQQHGESHESIQLYRWLLLAITLLGLGLRLIALNSQLWLDEITPILDYRSASAWQVLISYISSNNHLLNTLLVKLCIAVFGEQEWAIRLPAALFGTATIPVLYWLARYVLPRRASLGVALLLAVSYHHIFFSQDARAYTGYVFFSLLGTGLLVKGLQTDRPWIWALYVGTMVLNLASILLSGFVVAAHLAVGGLAVLLVKRRGASPAPLAWRLIMVFAAIGFLGFQIYAAVLPQMYVYMQAVYADPSAGFSPFSLEFLAEIARGLSAGFGTGLLFGAIPFLLVAGLGYVTLIKRNLAVVVGLTAPGALQALALLSRNLVFSPRFFILALPLAILVAVQGIDEVADFAARILKRSSTFSNRLSVGLVIIASLASLASLPYYYAVPKQAYRSSLEYLESTRQPSDIVIVIHLAESGYRYYGAQFHIREGQDYFYVRTVAALDEVLAEHSGQRSWLVVTFPRALRLSLPGLDARVQRDWQVIKEFPGTVGDGDITIWRQP
jgi:hypothetical protein